MTYDLVVIGSGPGGYSAAVRAGQYGLRTAIIEKDPRLGGTCLLVGCIPTKALLHTADVWEHFLHPEADGIECENPRLNYPKVIERKNGIVAKHSKGVEFLMKKNKVEWIKGFATLKGGGKIEVGGEKGMQTVEAKNIIIATGSAARMLPGLEPDPEFYPHQYRDSQPDTGSQIACDYRRGSGWRRIRFHLPSLRRRKLPCSRCCRASCLWKMKRYRRNWSAYSRKQEFASRPGPRRRTFARPGKAWRSP